VEHDRVDDLMDQWRAERPDLDPAPMATWGRIGRIYLLATGEIDAVMAAHGLERGLFDVLATLRRSGPPYRLSPSALAAATLVTTGGMTARLDRLEREGLVERLPDPGDRRAVQVQLTDAGRERVDACLTEHVANEERLLTALSARDRAQLDRLARKLLAGLARPTGAE
jgi:DNA-binding MarR family transcriptional regulator